MKKRVGRGVILTIWLLGSYKYIHISPIENLSLPFIY